MSKQKRPQVLILEDDAKIVTSLRNTHKKIEFTHADDLLDFHGYLYDEPGIESYALVIMDLQLSMDEHPETLLKEIFAGTDLFESSLTRPSRTCVLYGWDYYVRVIRKHNSTAPYADNKFIMLSGHGQWLMDNGHLSGDLSKTLVVDKGIAESDKKLIKRLNSLM
jgi:hypothetical protein